jgi:hypothetical protein
LNDSQKVLIELNFQLDVNDLPIENEKLDLLGVQWQPKNYYGDTT